MVEAAFLPNSQLNNLLNILPPVLVGGAHPTLKNVNALCGFLRRFLCSALPLPLA
jgi:hypothetical protein